MSTDCIKRFEQLLGRELSSEDKVRLLRIKDILGIDTNDALWDLLIAMDYQRIYYEDLPKKLNKVPLLSLKIFLLPQSMKWRWRKQVWQKVS